MYKLVFYFFYRYFLWRNDNSPTFGAICGVFMTIGFHLLFVYVLVQAWVGEQLLSPFSQNYGLNKLLNMVAIVPFFLLALRYFNKKHTNEIIAWYDSRENVFSIFNWILFIATAVAPLVLMMIILRK